MRRNFKNKGITLIALTVTVVVLLILAGTTISQVTENGIFSTSNMAKDNANKAEEKEILNTSAISSIGKSKRAKVEESYLRKYLEQNVGEEGKDYTVKSVEDNAKIFEIKFIKTDNDYVILEDGTVLEKSEYNGSIKTSSEDVIILEVGEIKEITVDTEGTKEPVIWSSSNDNVAKVKVEDITDTKKAMIKGISNGENIKITAKLSNGKFIEKRVTVQTSPQSISLNQTNVEFDMSGTHTDKLTVTYNPTTVNVNKNISWRSDNTEIATVDGSGNITGISNGTAIVTATTENGKIASCTVTVHTSPIKITISGTTILDMTQINGNKSENLTINYEPVTSDIYRDIIWKSDNAGIATVKDGTITGVSNGETTIMATTANGKAAQCSVTVQTSITDITLDKSNVTLDLAEIEAKRNVQLSATISPDSATERYTWSSSNTNVATVDSNGYVTGKADGTVNITAQSSSGKVSAMCTITVKTSVAVVAGSTNSSYSLKGGHTEKDCDEYGDVKTGTKCLKYDRDCKKESTNALGELVCIMFKEVCVEEEDIYERRCISYSKEWIDGETIISFKLNTSVSTNKLNFSWSGSSKVKVGSIRKSGTSYSVTLSNSSSSAASGTLTLEYSGGKTLYTWTIQ